MSDQANSPAQDDTYDAHGHSGHSGHSDHSDRSEQRDQVSNRLRALLLVIAVVVGLGVAAVPVVISLTGVEDDPSVSPTSTTGATDSSDATGTSSAGPVDAAGTRYSVDAEQRISCPDSATDSTGAQGQSTAGAARELREIRLPCLTDGGGDSEISLDTALRGKPTLVNVWAWWCQPCRAELPVLQAAAEKHPEWSIVGVHANGQGQAGVDLLADLGVRLASFQDSSGVFLAAAELPQVIPVSIIYRADGTRVSFHPGEITSVAELERIMAGAA